MASAARARICTAVLIPEEVSRKRKRSTRVFFFSDAKKICRKSDLRLCLVLAVTEVVVGEHGHHHAVHAARRELEWATFVVELVFARPAHAVRVLLRSRGVCLGQSKIFLAQANEMR